jgi:hypothetical protein
MNSRQTTVRDGARQPGPRRQGLHDRTMWLRFALWGGILFATRMTACAMGGAPDETHPWRVSVYSGRHTDTRFLEIIQGETRFRDSYMAAVALSRTWATWADYAEWDAEVQVAKHWGRQHHGEFNAAVLLRWIRFPWDQHLSTTIALGIGPSFASSTPKVERDRGKDTARRLAFMPFEITAGPPDRRWEGFVRVHHRSGAFDTISRGTGSNFVAGGIRMGW